jgi:hypothetical protein
MWGRRTPMYGDRRFCGSQRLVTVSGRALTLNLTNKPCMTCSRTVFLSTSLASFMSEESASSSIESLTLALGEINHCPVVQPDVQRFERGFIQLCHQFEE